MGREWEKGMGTKDAQIKTFQTWKTQRTAFLHRYKMAKLMLKKQQFNYIRSDHKLSDVKAGSGTRPAPATREQRRRTPNQDRLNTPMAHSTRVVAHASVAQSLFESPSKRLGR